MIELVPILSTVDISELLQTCVASIIATVSVTVVVCLAIWGATKYTDYSQEGRMTAATGALSVSIFGMVSTFAIVGLALYLLVDIPEI